MRVPVLVPIGPTQKVPIRYVRKIADDLYGEFCAEAFEIRVSKALCVTADLVWRTVWHELAHASLWISGWQRLLSDEQEEAIVTSLEHGIAPLMRFDARAQGVRWRNVRFPWED